MEGELYGDAASLNPPRASGSHGNARSSVYEAVSSVPCKTLDNVWTIF